MKNKTENGKINAGRMATGLLALVMCLLLLACSGNIQPKFPEKDLKSATAQIISGASTDAEKLERLFLFVRDEVDFNWIHPQDIPPQEVLKNGFGVCMQKAHLLSAMAREAGFQTRFRFMYVRKQALEDFLPAYAYERWVDPFPHTVVEILHQGSWRSFDPSFDTKLHRICLDKKINFARYPEIAQSYKTTFSPEGMKGAQEFWTVKDKEAFYGDTLAPLLNWESKNVAFFKRLMKPFIFKKARSIMDDYRR